MALAVGRRALPRYGHRFSRHDFTLPQLFAILVLRQCAMQQVQPATQRSEPLASVRLLWRG